VGAIVVLVLLVIAGIGSAMDGKDEPKGSAASAPTTLVATTIVSTTAVPPTQAPTTAAPMPTEPPPTEPPATVAPPPPTAAPAPNGGSGETVSQRNARQKAADYLVVSAFSRSGLIDQLVFEGSSQGDATYGVDAVKANWNEQAAKKAADYLQLSSFSRSGLIEQLVFEGFTQAQAEYGVSTTGL
jgi:hypothetical protein